MNKIHPSVQSMIDRGIFSFEPVEGWDFMFIDGNGWGVSGWCPPRPKPSYPRQDDRRNRRISLNTSFQEVGKALGVTSADVSSFEQGRSVWEPSRIDAYDVFLDQIEEEKARPSMFLFTVVDKDGRGRKHTAHSFISAARMFADIENSSFEIRLGMGGTDSSRVFCIYLGSEMVNQYTVTKVKSVG